MALPKYNELYGAFLNELADGKIHSYKEIKPGIAKQLNLSEEELSEKIASGGQTIFENRVGWARTYLKKLVLSLVLHVGILLFLRKVKTHLLILKK